MKDLTLDWRPIFRELKAFVLPAEAGLVQTSIVKRNHRTLTKMSTFAQLYIDPKEIPAILEEFLPYFNTSFVEGAFVVVGLLNQLFPTLAPPEPEEELMPQYYLPTFFHLWSLVNRSRTFDTMFIDLLSRLARDTLTAPQVPFSAYGIFTKDQSALIFTAILRLLDIPVGQAISPYSNSVDENIGLGSILLRDSKKHPISHHVARCVVMSLSPECLNESDSILSNLEGLIQAIETFFHPSNSGVWTRTLSQLVYFLADFFVMRWNRENSGEMEVPEGRKLTAEVKRRFVLCLRDVTFMGIYAKSGTAMNFAQSTLSSLAFLEPELILPHALQRIYPSMQGLVEVHRTASSLRALQMLARTLVRTKGYRCHVTSLLGLALPGIDANDLDKTQYTLSFLSAICYHIPFHDLTKGNEKVHDSMLAMSWITSEVDQMEQAGPDFELDYSNLSEEDEELILRSSTASFPEFLSSFLGKVFTLLENLPDAARVRSGSPEEQIINTIPSTFIPLLASLSPELYDLALTKIADFAGNHVIHQARDAMGFICDALTKTSPEKALKRLVPMFIASIRTEIDEVGAASSRSTGNEVMPRDRGLVWNLTLLSLTVVNAGEALLLYREELIDIAAYMQEKCKGLATAHVSTLTHHLLTSLTCTYTLDFNVYEPEIVQRGLGPEDWGRITRPDDLDINWHVPSEEEIDFAIEIFRTQGSAAMTSLKALIDGTSPTKRDGSGKAWSDELSKHLVLLRVLLSGISVLFDGTQGTQIEEYTSANGSVNSAKDVGDSEDSTEAALAATDDNELRPTFKYPDGYAVEKDGMLYRALHKSRADIGALLHRVHSFLVENQEDDVSCFMPLYMAYRTWFVDMGIERSAHTLDRTTRLYASETAPYKTSGLHKEYPRPLLLRRAHLYHLQRLRHNASPRKPNDLEKQLLLDLAHSTVSPYTDVRRHSQSAIESAAKVIVGARPLLIPPILEAFESGVKDTDFGRIKGGIHTLLFGSLAKTIHRDWRLAPRVIRAYLAACDVDKPSVQKLCSGATFQIMEFGRSTERMVILDQDAVKLVAPSFDVSSQVAKRRDKVKKKRAAVEAKKAKMSDELVEMTRHSHWKTASRTAAIVVTLGFRFDSIVSNNLVDLLVNGTIDTHPGLRGLFSGAFVALYSLMNTRILYEHSFENYLLEKPHVHGKIEVTTMREDESWTAEYLSSFARPETAYYVDHEHPGWLVWAKTLPAYKSDIKEIDKLDDQERRVVGRIGEKLTKEWFSTFFGYLLQEPRDQSSDRFRMPSAMLLGYSFEWMHLGHTSVTFDEIKDEIVKMYGDGSDKHKHRATAEVLGGLLSSVWDKSLERRTKVWEFCMSMVLKIFSDGLTPENYGYWTTFLHLLLQGKDPRRAWPLIEWLADFRLDMSTNAAFKESSKITLLHQAVADCGWHFRLEKPIVENFLSHIDHPYKGVREAMGHTLAAIYRTRYHESFKDVDTLLYAQRKVSSIGERPYQTSPEFKATMQDIFGRIEKWRQERPPGQQETSPYTSGSKTVLLWLDSTLASYECTQLLELFPNMFMEPLLHMMDVKEDQELQQLAYHVFRHLPNVPHRLGEDAEMISSLTRIGTTSPFWHQRYRVLLNMQVIYFRRLFLISSAQQRKLFDCVASMLNDTQLEVRKGAAMTLSGMVQCSPVSLRNSLVKEMNQKFTSMLLKNPLPKKPRGPLSSAPSTGTSTPTPEHTKLVITRHAAVLGLGALIQAFPYSSPPPEWIPGVLTTLANKANGDPGIVGKEVKTILSHFKKTRQDTWSMDLKVCRHYQSFIFWRTNPIRCSHPSK